MNIAHVIKQPLVTEKTTQMASKGVYAFEVHSDVNKHQVAEVISKIYQVTVKKVRMTVRKGTMKRVGRKMITKQMPDVKIAYVTVSKGTIDLFPQA